MNKISDDQSQKIIELLKAKNPGTWWRQYPPALLAEDKKPILNIKKIKPVVKQVFSDGKKGVGLYVHIPFCPSRCSFCKFYSLSEGTYKKEIIEKYLASLEREIIELGVDFKKKLLDNLYIGGGTPTLLDANQWLLLMRIINKHFSFKRGAQMSTEGTPDTISYDKIELLVKLGFRRFTLGVQSFDDHVLNLAGRRHRSKDSRRAYRILKKAKMPIVNFDIIYGFPGEKESGWQKTIREIVSLKPERVSIYPLDIGSGVGLFSKKSYLNKKHLKQNIFTFQSIIRKVLLDAGYQVDRSGFYGFYLPESKNSRNENLLLRYGYDSVLGLGVAAESLLVFRDKQGNARSLRYRKDSNLNNYLSRGSHSNTSWLNGYLLTSSETLREYLIFRLLYHRGKINKRNFLTKFCQDDLVKIRTIFKSKDLNQDIIFENAREIIIRPFSHSFSGSTKEGFFELALKYIFSQNQIEELIKKIK